MAVIAVLPTTAVLAVCSSTIPTSGDTFGKDSAVQLSFWQNPGGGSFGADCPTSCTGTPIKQQWYAIKNDVDTCYQWPGHSGENSMKSGTCHTEKIR